MIKPPSRILEQVLRIFIILFVCGSALFFVAKTVRWPVTGDSAVLHYGTLLLDHGKTPYLDFAEPDLPGTYLQEKVAMRVFGSGDLGWHIYDLFLLGVLCWASAVIAKPYDSLAGICAGITFAVIHLSFGARNAAQREEVMAVCTVLALAFLFQSNRARQPWLMAPYGFFIGIAASIKPTACVFGLLSFLMLLLALKHERVRAVRYSILGVIGFAAATSLTVLFLWRYQAFYPFLFDLRVVIPYYARIGIQPTSALITGIARPFRGAVLFGILLAVWQRRVSWIENWERAVLLVAIGFGLFSYVAQRKVFEHHLYAFYVFTLLFFFIEAFRALNRTGTLRVAGVLAVLCGVSVSAFYTRRLSRIVENDAPAHALVSDLTRLGGANLGNRVKCFDLVLACSSAFYRMGIVEDFALLNDFTVLPSKGAPPLLYYRERLWHNLQVNPPLLIVVTDQQLVHASGFDKLEQWPDFTSFLNSQYYLGTTKSFPEGTYRIYVRKDPDVPVSPSSAPLASTR